MAASPATIGLLFGFLFAIIGFFPAYAFYAKDKANGIRDSGASFIFFPLIFFIFGFIIGVLGAPK